jgi:transcriptional regulator with XRE-family HTH domain
MVMERGRARPYSRIGQRVADLRRAAGRRRGERLTQRELADTLGVHQTTVAAWEIGRQRPEGENLVRLAEVLGSTPEAILADGSEGVLVGVGAQAEPEAEELMAFFDQTVRFLGGIAPSGQEKARKLDALEGLRRMLTARGMLPDWWYALRDRVENDEL